MKPILKILEDHTAKARFNNTSLMLIISQDRKTGECTVDWSDDSEDGHKHQSFEFIGAIEAAKYYIIKGNTDDESIEED